MRAKLDSTLDDPQQIIADLRHRIALRTAKLDDAQRKLKERTEEAALAVTDMPALAVLIWIGNWNSAK